MSLYDIEYPLKQFGSTVWALPLPSFLATPAYLLTWGKGTEWDKEKALVLHKHGLVRVKTFVTNTD